MMKDPEQYNKLYLVGVDVQNDFCPGGALGVAEGDLVVSPLNAVAKWTRENSGQVLWTKDAHPEKTDHFDKWPVHCVEGTMGADFHPSLDVKPDDIIIRKGTGTKDDGYSGFEGAAEDGTTIREIICNPEPVFPERVAILIGGLATDYCVKATVLDANEIKSRYNYPEYPNTVEVYVIEDAIRAVNLAPRDEKEAVALMKRRGAGAKFVTSEDILASNVLEVVR